MKGDKGMIPMLSWLLLHFLVVYGVYAKDPGRLSYKEISSNHHFSDYLDRGVTKRLVFTHESGENPLSFILTPCTSVLLWTISYSAHDGNETSKPKLLRSFRTQRQVAFTERLARPGIYLLELSSLVMDSYLRIFASGSPNQSDFLPWSASINTEVPYSYLYYENNDSRSHPSQRNLNSTARIWTKNLRDNRVQVKWAPYNPWNGRSMEYCIVINTRRDYSSLCSASGDKFGVTPPGKMQISHFYRRRKKNEEPPWSRNEGLTLGCTGNRNQFILNTDQAQLIYFNVFLMDPYTSLSFPYARTTVNRRPRRDRKRGDWLRDSSPTRIKVSSNRSTLLRFRLSKPCNVLTLYAMGCGGGEGAGLLLHLIYLKRNQSRIIYSSSVGSLTIVKVAMPSRGNYLLRLVQDKNSSVAMLAEAFVSKKNAKFPLPRLPANKKVWEKPEERGCDSTVINFMPSPDPRDTEYCIFLKEEDRPRSFSFKEPIQCDVERVLRADPWVSISFCLQRDLQDITKPLTQRIGGLSPSKTYVLQLIVRRYKGRSLSYDLTTISTLSECTNRILV